MKVIYKFNDFLNEGAPAIKMEDAIELIKNKCKEKGYEFLGFVDNKWNGNDTKLILKCNKHNHTWKTSTLKNFKRDKSRCEYCSRESSAELQYIPEKEAIDKINKICKEKNYKFLGFIDKWKGKKTYLSLKCNKPGHGIWNTTIYESFLLGRGCPICGDEISKDSRRFSEEEAKSNVLKKCKEKGYEFLGFVGGKYINNKTKLILSCPINNHGKWDKTSYNGLFQGSGCPICKESKGAAKIAKYLEDFGFTKINKSEYDTIKQKKLDKKYYIREFYFDDCRSEISTFDKKRSRPLPFDFFLPNYNLCIK